MFWKLFFEDFRAAQRVLEMYFEDFRAAQRVLDQFWVGLGSVPPSGSAETLEGLQGY